MNNIVLSNEKNFMGLNKSHIADIASDYVSKIDDGHIDPIEGLILSKKIQELGSALEKKIRPIAEGDHTIGSKQELVKFDAKIIQKETGVKYDYSACNDTEWNILKSEFDSISNKIKERESFLKNLTKPMADIDSGEVINPPIRSGKLGLAITLK